MSRLDHGGATAPSPSHESGIVASPSAAMDTTLEYLKFIRHHFLSRVTRTTPSGRQQSGVLLVLPDAVCVLSNRGGLHTYLPLQELVAITVYPRARICFHGSKRRHDLLITCTQQPRLVGIVSQLFLGLTGNTLSVHQEDTPPSLERLMLRPVPDAPQPAVPQSLVRALRSAAVSAATYSTSVAATALIAADPSVQSQPDVLSNTSGLERGSVTPVVRTQQFQTEGGRHTTGQTVLSTSGVAGTPMLSSSHMTDAQAGMTMLVVESSSTTITVPVLRALWVYLQAMAKTLPRATSAPLVLIRCVESRHVSIELNATLFHQTMTMFAEDQPHIVTLQKWKTDEGHHFDGSVFWTSMAAASGGSTSALV